MTLSKKEKFSKDDIRLAAVAKAFSHPARIAIIRHLASTRTSCFNDISKQLPLADSTVSQHLTELKSAGLIEYVFEPPRMIYSIDFDGWKQAKKFLKDFTKIKPAKATNESPVR